MQTLFDSYNSVWKHIFAKQAMLAPSAATCHNFSLRQAISDFALPEGLLYQHTHAKYTLAVECSPAQNILCRDERAYSAAMMSITLDSTVDDPAINSDLHESITQGHALQREVDSMWMFVSETMLCTTRHESLRHGIVATFACAGAGETVVLFADRFVHAQVCKSSSMGSFLSDAAWWQARATVQIVQLNLYESVNSYLAQKVQRDGETQYSLWSVYVDLPAADSLMKQAHVHGSSFLARNLHRDVMRYDIIRKLVSTTMSTSQVVDLLLSYTSHFNFQPAPSVPTSACASAVLLNSDAG